MASTKQKLLKNKVIPRRKMDVLICTNGKKSTEASLNFGCSLLKPLKPNLTVLYVRPDKKANGRGFVNRAKKIAAKHGLKAKTKIRTGEPFIEIVKESQQRNYDLVVTGYTDIPEELRKLSEIFVSKVIDNIAKEIKTSMFIIKTQRKLKKILICTDGSRSSENAIKFFASLKVECAVDILNVIPEVYSRFKDILEGIAEQHLQSMIKVPGEHTKYLYKAKELLAKYGIKANIILKEGYAAEEIVNLAYQDYDLIVLGTRGWKGEKRKVMGRQVRQVIRNSPTSIIAIR